MRPGLFRDGAVAPFLFSFRNVRQRTELSRIAVENQTTPTVTAEKIKRKDV
jgi:hypothetical protein